MDTSIHCYLCVSPLTLYEMKSLAQDNPVRFGCAASPSRALWIAAICVDYPNIAVQVARRVDWYTKATTGFIVWLGS